MNRGCLALVAFLIVPPALPAQEANWSEFRGPTGQGIAAAERLPLEWGPNKNVAWKQEIPGKGWSSPVVWAGHVYLTTSVLATDAAKDQSLRALCLDSATGKVLWDQEVFHEESAKAAGVHSKNSHASPTPLVDGEHLYVHFGHQGTACLDLEGKVLWKNTSLSYQPVHGNGGSPVLVDEALIFSVDGADKQFVVALDRKTGDVLWKTDRKSRAAKRFSFSTPLVITVKDRKQVISPASDVVTAYDPGTGREIWRVRYNGYSVVPRPIFGNGLVFLSCGYDSPVLLAIRPDGEGDVTDTHIAWTTRKGAPLTPSPLLCGDDLYLLSDDGTVTCLESKTGKERWHERIGGTYSASPLLAGERLYVQSEDGVGMVLKVGPRFEQLARNDLEEPSLASFAVTGRALLIRTEKHLYKIQDK